MIRTVSSVTIGAGQTTGIATLGPFDKGSVLQGFTLFGQTVPTGATLTVRLCASERPPVSVAEVSGGDLLSFPFVVPGFDGFWLFPVSNNARVLTKRFLAVEYVFGANLAAQWVGGFNAAVLPQILHRWSIGDQPGVGGSSMRLAQQSLGVS